MVNKMLLPHDLKQVVDGELTTTNFGLLFERMIPDIGPTWEQGITNKGIGVHGALNNIADQWNRSWSNVQAGLTALIERQAAAAEDFAKSTGSKALTFNAELDYQLAAGLGNAGVYENGMTLYPVYGFPYLPGSSIKGIVRGWLREQVDWKEMQPTSPGADLPEGAEKIFGRQEQRGLVQFWDALPIKPPEVFVDIMNPHFGEYYQGKKPPADWLDPSPVFFLTVKPGSRFRGHLVLHSEGLHLENELRTWVKEALLGWGAGGKTRSGYGQFRSFGWDDETNV